ncbi:hypothetical protein GOODEAATRI_018283 [Goodea atripinnis]|uniref:Secreted protein n=1 Tax=Goodea atripinnis TaxID=208336 RepID=A0ABV0PZ10_9TELE
MLRMRMRGTWLWVWLVEWEQSTRGCKLLSRSLSWSNGETGKDPHERFLLGPMEHGTIHQGLGTRSKATERNSQFLLSASSQGAAANHTLHREGEETAQKTHQPAQSSLGMTTPLISCH